MVRGLFLGGKPKYILHHMARQAKHPSPNYVVMLTNTITWATLAQVIFFSFFIYISFSFSFLFIFMLKFFKIQSMQSYLLVIYHIIAKVAKILCYQLDIWCCKMSQAFSLFGNILWKLNQIYHCKSS
jgi:hypothetical protein